MKKLILFFVLAFLMTLRVGAQQYTSMSGLIHVPSAEMDAEGDARIGVHYLNQHMVPDVFSYEGEKYNTFDHYVSITPFWWIEIGYTCTLLKIDKYKINKLTNKDRYFSFKLNPLREGKWWPAVAVGCNDIADSRSVKDETADGELYFANYYLAATKHVDLSGNEIGVHLSYRHYTKAYNDKWNGVVGGVTFRPEFAKNCRVIAEYTGSDINVGIDCLLLKHLLMQASLQSGKYFSGGICYTVNLF